MKDIRREIAGRQAKRRGEAFEEILKASAYRNKWTIIDIPDGCRQVSAVKLIRVKSPFDFVFLKNKRAIFCDAKTTKQKVFAFSGLTPHQTKLLKEIHDQGFKAGYIVNFTEQKQTVFFPGNMLIQKSEGSLKPEDGTLIGENFIINLDRVFYDEVLTHGEQSKK